LGSTALNVILGHPFQPPIKSAVALRISSILRLTWLPFLQHDRRGWHTEQHRYEFDKCVVHLAFNGGCGDAYFLRVSIRAANAFVRAFG
jgi:hypothetical protein